MAHRCVLIDLDRGLEDIAALTGAQVVSDELGIKRDAALEKDVSVASVLALTEATFTDLPEPDPATRAPAALD